MLKLVDAAHPVPKTCPQIARPSSAKTRRLSKRAYSSRLPQAFPNRPHRVPLFQGGTPWSPATGRSAGTLRACGDLDGGLQRCREVLCAAYPDNRTIRFAAISLTLEPSDGLEPSTPSLPWRFPGVTRVHARSLAAQFLLQIDLDPDSRDASRDVARVVSDVSVLCPRCVVRRGIRSYPRAVCCRKTHNGGRACD
jgi:hypothetical protein